MSRQSKKIDFQASGGENYEWEYIKYCRDNKISYARVNDEIVNKGTFKITSYNIEKRQYTGSFTAHGNKAVYAE